MGLRRYFRSSVDGWVKQSYAMAQAQKRIALWMVGREAGPTARERIARDMGQSSTVAMVLVAAAVLLVFSLLFVVDAYMGRRVAQMAHTDRLVEAHEQRMTCWQTVLELQKTVLPLAGEVRPCWTRTLAWAAMNGAIVEDVCVEDLPNGVRGVVQRGAKARLAVPLSMTIAVHGDVGLSILSPTHIVQKQFALAIELLAARKEERWEAYLGDLPSLADLQLHPMLSPSSELEAFRGLKAVDQAKLEKAFARKTFSTLEGLRVEHKAGLDRAGSRAISLLVGLDSFTWEDFQWAYIIVLTRSFVVPACSDEALSLIPVLDAVNHELQHSATGALASHWRAFQGQPAQWVSIETHGADGHEVTWPYVTSTPDTIAWQYGMVLDGVTKDQAVDCARLSTARCTDGRPCVFSAIRSKVCP